MSELKPLTLEEKFLNWGLNFKDDPEEIYTTQHFEPDLNLLEQFE